MCIQRAAQCWIKPHTMAAKLLHMYFLSEHSETFPNTKNSRYCREELHCAPMVYLQQQETLCSSNMQNFAFCSTAWHDFCLFVCFVFLANPLKITNFASQIVGFLF